MGFGPYSPGQVIVAWNGVQLLGYADGTFIQVARAEDGFTTVVGSGGDVVRTQNLNRTGSVTVTILEESPTNTYLTTAAAQDELFGLSTGPLTVKNVLGTLLVVSDISWIRKIADVEYAKESGSRQWVFDCAELVFSGGGALVF